MSEQRGLLLGSSPTKRHQVTCKKRIERIVYTALFVLNLIFLSLNGVLLRLMYDCKQNCKIYQPTGPNNKDNQIPDKSSVDSSDTTKYTVQDENQIHHQNQHPNITEQFLRRPRSTGNHTGKAACFLYLDVSQTTGENIKWTSNYSDVSFITSTLQLLKGERIRIGNSGLYFISVSIQLDAYTWEPEEKFQIIQQNILKNPGRKLIYFNKASIIKNDTFPIITNLIARLQTGDEIYVNIHSEQRKYIYNQPEANFFGLMQLT